MAGLLFGAMVLFLLINVPIAVSLGMASIVALNYGDMPVPPLVVAQRMFTAIDSFPFMAIPFFMLAGTIMESGGISHRLINFTRTLVGGVPGGLGVITIVASAFFGAISGSNPATVAAIGGIMIPSMIKAGYPKDFAAAIAAAGGTLGVIIPPSIPMIMYGVVAGVSIGALFMAGFIPGIILALALTLVVVYNAKKLGLKGEKRATFTEFLAAAKDAVLALMMPFIILGGIYGGVFTPTEAASVAVVYAFLISIFVYREIKIKDMGSILAKAGVNTSIVLLVIATSASFSWLITSAQIPAMIADAMLGISEKAFVLILLINLLLLFLGIFLETTAIILLITPILLPLALQIGLDPILLGIIMVINTSIGMITPPMAVNLFVACGISNLRIEQISRRIVPFLIVGIVIILLISNIPQLSLWLPQVLLN